MMELKILGGSDIRRAVSLDQIMESVESVYTKKAEGKTVVWPTVFHEFDPGHQDMDIKSGYIMGEEVHGLKSINWTEANTAKGLPDLVGLILVFDTATGMPLGLLNAGFITGLRTGCAGAVGAKYLARRDSETLLMIGTGAQSLFLIGAFLRQFPALKTVYIANPHHPEKAQKYADTVKERLMQELHVDAGSTQFCAAENLQKAVGKSDMIATATPSRTPLIQKEWVKPGTHISCIGADLPGKEEIDPEILRDAVIFCDDAVHCAQAGELELPLANGVIGKEAVRGEIGSLILGTAEGRTDDSQITVYDATGMALLDIAAAKAALAAAKEKSLGQTVEI